MGGVAGTVIAVSVGSDNGTFITDTVGDGRGMFDGVPTRAERIAAVIAIAAGCLMVPFATLGYGIATIASLLVAVTCGTIAKARVDLDALLTFGIRSVPEDDPNVERYRERRRRTNERIERVATREYDPRFDRLLAIGLAIVGIGALAVVATTENGDTRSVGRLLMIALIALNCALIAYAASYVDTSDD